MTTRSEQVRKGLSKKELQRNRQEAARRNRRFFLVGTVAMVLLLIVAIVFTRSDQGEVDEGRETGAVTIAGTPLPAFDPEVSTDQAVGVPVPELAGRDFESNRIAIANDGTPKLIMFLAHWCHFCQNEVPVIQTWLDEQGAPNGIDLFSVSTGVDPAAPNYPPSAWLEREGWTVPVIADDEASAAGTAFGVSSYPYFVFVDSDGRVVSRASGALPIEQIEAGLATLH